MNLLELNTELLDCRRCPRLVVWREKVSLEKRRAYWDGPIGGNRFQDLETSTGASLSSAWHLEHTDPTGPDANLPGMPLEISSTLRFIEPGLHLNRNPSLARMGSNSPICTRLQSAGVPRRVTNRHLWKWQIANPILSVNLI